MFAIFKAYPPMPITPDDVTIKGILWLILYKIEKIIFWKNRHIRNQTAPSIPSCNFKSVQLQKQERLSEDFESKIIEGIHIIKYVKRKGISNWFVFFLKNSWKPEYCLKSSPESIK